MYTELSLSPSSFSLANRALFPQDLEGINGAEVLKDLLAAHSGLIELPVTVSIPQRNKRTITLLLQSVPDIQELINIEYGLGYSIACLSPANHL